jgi:TPP-dependent pyruvate/acetoin dehydrogenase alpha subunit
MTVLPTADLLGAYRQMLLIRHFEEKVLELRLAGDIVGSVHLCNGQEAIAVGVCSARDDRDPVFATYRGHGWALACGSEPETLFRELLGRQGGTNEGRGGSAYLSDPSVHFMGENSIVGAGGPIAAGAALASSVDGSGEVAVTAFGDGALNQGALHEALNFASALTLPLIFVCENNFYSELTPIADMVGQPELYRRAEAYGMAGERVDGNDPSAVQEVAARAFERARSGGGPTLIEAMTERLCGHYIGDTEQYRPPGEVEDAQTREPLVVASQRLLVAGQSQSSLADIGSAASDQIDSAAARALSAPLADASSAQENVYG